MEFKHDFLEKSGKTSRIRTIMGLLLVSYSIFLVWDSHSNLGSVLIFSVWGVNTFFEGLGIPPASLVGEKFILVNEEKIHFKYNLFKKGMILHPKDIDYIDLWPGNIIVCFNTEQKEKVDLRDLDPQTRHDTLLAIAAVAEKMQIKYTKHGYLKHYN